jgi:5-methyltetrahydropteroyltriglutamate--homocysteine methyltransferase
MDPVLRHSFKPDVSFNGGNMDCGNGLLLLIRKSIDPLPAGGILEVLSTEGSVEEDLPSWCRMTGNEFISFTREGQERSYLVSKGALASRSKSGVAAATIQFTQPNPVQVQVPSTLPEPAPIAEIRPLSVMGMGSWPRPRWMLQAVHDHMEGRLPDADFQATADDAVRLAVDAQLRAGVDVVTDGEQRRDNYASFVGGLLDNCVLVPLTDLLPLVDDPAHFQEEMKSLDVPADKIRHPAVFGPIGRSKPLAGHELEFVRSLTDKPVKVALPGPYLLTRTMWMECLTENAYQSREQLAEDVVRVLREELHYLLAAGAALVQFDEPVLSEVVFTGAKSTRSFMCGALSEKKDAASELAFAQTLINAVVDGVPRSRTAMHVCRGNWTPDESAALHGDYDPLLTLLSELQVGTLFLELCTPRAGSMEVLKDLPRELRIGVGVVNQKKPGVETVDEIVARGREAVRIFGADRVLFNPDCGFATFADNPVSSATIAEQKLRAIVQAAEIIRRG